MVPDRDRIPAREAAALLGVKLPTLYAYVSRGLLASAPGGRGRARRYLREDVLRLRDRRARGGGAASALRWGEPVLESAITRMSEDGPIYRGQPALALARGGATLEAVAELLWSGRLPGPGAPPDPGWSPADFGVPVRRLAALVPDGSPPLAALQLAVPALGAADPGRFDVRREAVLPRARALIRRLAAAPALAIDPARVERALGARGVADTLAVALGGRAGARASDALRQALVLCADHELNASTFAARVAASTGADVHAAVGAALGAFSGPLHGGVTERVEAMLAEIGRPERAERVMNDRLRRGEAIPGFGHPFYTAGDPRSRPLLERARALAPARSPARAALALVDAAATAGRPAPNLDLGLVALATALGLPPGSAAAIFAVGRAAGWVAHILEQQETGHLLRPRARFAEPPGAGAAGGER
jgi:citrate synthase